MLTGERVWEEPWPDADPALLERDTFEIVAPDQRQAARPDAGAAERRREAARALARERPRVQAHIDGHEVVKVSSCRRSS